MAERNPDANAILRRGDSVRCRQVVGDCHLILFPWVEHLNFGVTFVLIDVETLGVEWVQVCCVGMRTTTVAVMAFAGRQQ